jgi:hypothetical protein
MISIWMPKPNPKRNMNRKIEILLADLLHSYFEIQKQFMRSEITQAEFEAQLNPLLKNYALKIRRLYGSAN